VGEDLGVTPERVRQIEISALKKCAYRLRKAGVKADDVRATGKAEPAPTYLRVKECVDCFARLPDALRSRCPECEASEEARRGGYEEAHYAHRAFMRGMLRILKRWPGMTT